MNIQRTRYHAIESTGQNAPTPHYDDPRFEASRMAYHHNRRARIWFPWILLAAIISTAWTIYTLWPR